MFNEFKTLCTWRRRYNLVISTTFERKASKSLARWLKLARDKRKPGRWLLQDVFDQLCIYWDSPEFKAISEQAKKARTSVKGGSLHTGGAKSTGTIAREMEKILGRTPTQAEVFRRTHVKKKKNESDPDVWVEPRAQNAYTEFDRYLSEFTQTEQCAPTHDQQTQLWTHKVAGERQKGRIYGLGSRNNLRRIQSGLQGIGSSAQAAAIDSVQLATMSQQIAELTRALAQSEAQRKTQNDKLTATVEQLQQQVVHMARGKGRRLSSTSSSGSEDTEGTDDEFVDPTP